MKDWKLPQHFGYYNRPTWAIVTWLTNVEEWYFKSRSLTKASDSLFARRVLEMMQNDKTAVGDINPSGNQHRWDVGLRANVDWVQIRKALMET